MIYIFSHELYFVYGFFFLRMKGELYSIRVLKWKIYWFFIRPRFIDDIGFFFFILLFRSIWFKKKLLHSLKNNRYTHVNEYQRWVIPCQFDQTMGFKFGWLFFEVKLNLFLEYCTYKAGADLRIFFRICLNHIFFNGNNAKTRHILLVEILVYSIPVYFLVFDFPFYFIFSKPPAI
jgi:hypothetical protein